MTAVWKEVQGQVVGSGRSDRKPQDRREDDVEPFGVKAGTWQLLHFTARLASRAA